MNRYRGNEPPIGSSGEFFRDGYWWSYRDIPMSGDLLHDDPHCPDWVKDDQDYWVRFCAGSQAILGPVLTIANPSGVAG